MAQIDVLLEAQKNRGASDLHLTPECPASVRLQGDIQPLSSSVLTHDHIASLIYEILSPHQREIIENEKDLDLAYEPSGLARRFRVNVFHGRLGLSAVFRMIPSQVPTPEQINLPRIALDMIQQAKGLIIVTGATGSGKSTTLAAMVDHINRTRRLHILSVEDPIEFIHTSRTSLVNQREVGHHTRSFARALRSALREDPDVILVGEMRDLETMELAATAAETGHLVLATLHTSTAAKTVDRLINVFPVEQQAQIRLMVSESMKGIIAQNLVKTVDGKRTAAFEVLVNNSAISSLIRSAKTHQIPSIMQTNRAVGMVTMDDALMALVNSRRVLPEDAAKYATPNVAAILMGSSRNYNMATPTATAPLAN